MISAPKGQSDTAEADKGDDTSSEAAIKALFSTASSFYGYWVEESLVTHNPIQLIRQESKFVRKDQNASVARRLSTLQCNTVLDTAEQLAAEHPDEHERTFFIMTALYAMYLRISERVDDERSAPVMGDFRKDNDGHWWIHVTGKGNKDRTVSVSNAMLRALKRYRLSLKLSALPYPATHSPW